MRYILKTYRFFLLLLFVGMMTGGSIILYMLYEFIQPMDYTIQSLGDIIEPGILKVEIISSKEEPLGVTLISPSGKHYTQSSRDVINKTKGLTTNLSIKTADIGEWKIKYRHIHGVDVSLNRTYKRSNAAILVDTKATPMKNNKNKYIITPTLSNDNYTYNIKAIRRNDGFSLTYVGDSNKKSFELKPYKYQGVWDFYLNTKCGKETYNTMFSYTF